MVAVVVPWLWLADPVMASADEAAVVVTSMAPMPDKPVADALAIAADVADDASVTGHTVVSTVTVS